ncbi:hypothetical protein ABK040_011312 [Willaertia magna]
MSSTNTDNVFTPEFMTQFKESWNKDDTIPSTLSSIDFNAQIGYGYQQEEKPRTILIVKKGLVSEAREYRDEALDWDIRCSLDNWKYYFNNGLGMTGLASAYSMGWMKFVKGNYLSMIQNPKMIGPFLKSFELMGSVFKNVKY